MRASYLLPALLMAAGCPDPGPTAAPASRTADRPLTHQVRARADLTLADAVVVLRASWGDGPKQLGKRDEASRPGPMDIAVDQAGVIHLLDQVNRRVQRFSPDGRLLKPLALEAETAEHIALAEGKVWALSYRPDTAGHSLDLLTTRGPRRLLTFAPGDEPVTGLFAARGALWLEHAHARVTRVLPEGDPVVVLGRPRGGTSGHHLAAALREGAAFVMGVIPGQTTYRLLQVSPGAGEALAGLEALTSGSDGMVALGLTLRRGEHDTRRVAVVWRPGAPALTVELALHQATDMNNYLAAGPGGALYQLHTTEQGVTVRRWRMPAGREVRP